MREGKQRKSIHVFSFKSPPVGLQMTLLMTAEIRTPLSVTVGCVCVCEGGGGVFTASQSPFLKVCVCGSTSWEQQRERVDPREERKGDNSHKRWKQQWRPGRQAPVQGRGWRGREPSTQTGSAHPRGGLTWLEITQLVGCSSILSLTSSILKYRYRDIGSR